MPRKPNYSFERKERERIKAEKKAKRAAAKDEARASSADVSHAPVHDDDTSSESQSGEARGSS